MKKQTSVLAALGLVSTALCGCILGDHDFGEYERAPTGDSETTREDESSSESVCVPGTCADVEAECGSVPDGCGGTLHCGQCATGQLCGAERPQRCGPSCKPRTCSELGHQCGRAHDGCGRELDCGRCWEPDVCVEGPANVCFCQALTCVLAGAQCGELDDGCGGEIECGRCGPKHECDDNRCVKKDD